MEKTFSESPQNRNVYTLIVFFSSVVVFEGDFIVISRTKFIGCFYKFNQINIEKRQMENKSTALCFDIDG